MARMFMSSQEVLDAGKQLGTILPPVLARSVT
jgi:hypothetical protein